MSNFKLTYSRGFKTESLVFQSNKNLGEDMIKDAQQILDKKFGPFNICEVLFIDEIKQKEINNGKI